MGAVVVGAAVVLDGYLDIRRLRATWRVLDTRAIPGSLVPCVAPDTPGAGVTNTLLSATASPCRGYPLPSPDVLRAHRSFRVYRDDPVVFLPARGRGSVQLPMRASMLPTTFMRVQEPLASSTPDTATSLGTDTDINSNSDTKMLVEVTVPEGQQAVLMDPCREVDLSCTRVTMDALGRPILKLPASSPAHVVSPETHGMAIREARQTLLDSPTVKSIAVQLAIGVVMLVSGAKCLAGRGVGGGMFGTRQRDP